MAPATKATQKRLNAAVTAFNARYSDPQQWGEQRWHDTLYPALSHPTTYCAVINRYAVDVNQVKTILSDSTSDDLQRVDFPTLLYPHDTTTSKDNEDEVIALERQSGHNTTSQTHAFPPPKPFSPALPLLTHWNMDLASVLAAHLLQIHPGDRVLDMCAAPGGKSVVLSQSLFPHLYTTTQPTTLPPTSVLQRSALVSNELDTTRYKRLSANLKAYLPASLFPTPENPQGQVRVLNRDLSGKDAVASLPHGQASYDKVLVDAPCSSERHIVHAYEKARTAGAVAEEMMNWKASHVVALTKVQVGLLMNAVRAVKVGGRVLYATCAIGWEENDGVVERVLEGMRAERKKLKETWEVEVMVSSDEVDPVLERMTERTEFGRIALPDRAGWGPLYFAVLIKRAKERKGRAKVSHESASEDRSLAVESEAIGQAAAEKQRQSLTLDDNTTQESSDPLTR